MESERRPLRVLLVEDNPGDARLVLEMLGEADAAARPAVTRATTLAEAASRLAEAAYDVILLDLTLPDSFGPDTLTAVLAAAPDVAVVVLTGLDDAATGEELVRAGAQDYLVKGRIDGGLLSRTLHHAAERRRLLSRVEGLNDDLERRVAVRTAMLTGVNRALRIVSLCDQAVVQAEDPQGLLTRICRIAVEAGGYRYAWAAQQVRGGDGFRVVAAHGPGVDLTVSLCPQRVLGPGEWAPLAEAVDARRPVVIPDLTSTVPATRWEAQALRRGFAGAVILPVMDGADIAALVCLYAGEIHACDSNELDLMTELAASVGHGITGLRIRDERIQAARDLADRERLLEGVIETAPTLVVLADEQGRVRLFNRACEALTGYTREEVLGRPLMELLVPPAWRETVTARFAPAALPEQIHPHENPWITRAGEERMIEWRCVPLPGDGGQGGFVLGIGHDISERRAAEDTMRRLSGAVEQTASLIAMTDTRGVIEYVNPAFEAATGYSRDELIGQSIGILRSGEHDEEFYRRKWSALSAGRPFGDVFVSKRKDGGLFYEQRTMTPLRDDTGAVCALVCTGVDITEQVQARERLRELVSYDPLTGLANRALLRERFEQAAARARRDGGSIAVITLDLDGFGEINDRFGHEVGDRLLVETSRRLLDAVRAEDTVARVAADEFVILAEGLARADDAGAVIDQLQRALGAAFRVGERELTPSASMGVSLYPADGVDAETLLGRAAAALHQAKTGVRGRYAFFTEAMNRRTAARLDLLSDLQHALARDELTLHFQPLVDVTHGRVVAAEALLRWEHPERGSVAPDEFIGLLEETGLINDVGRWVLERACAECRAWHAAGLPDVRVCVNLSAHQLREPGFLMCLGQVLQQSGLAPGHLELEITESVLLEADRAHADLLAQIRDLGVGISLDDFGTGYSSLGYLRRFPVSVIKIDRAFVEGVTETPGDAAIARAVISMAHSLGLKVVAEGVETEAQLNYLAAHGCDLIQGFLYSPPLDAERFRRLLAEPPSLVASRLREPETQRILVVDDDPNILSALRRVLRRDGYQVLTAGSVEAAFEILANHAVGVMISDQRMPGLKGTEFLQRVKSLHPDTARIALTGYTGIDTVVEAVNQGAVYKFLLKPWDDEMLRQAVAEAFRARAAAPPKGVRCLE